MMKNAGTISTRCFFAALVFAGLALTGAVGLALSSAPAYAATTVEGCDPKVEQTHQAKAQVETAVDVNGTESISQKPDSTAAMTCFNVLAGNDSDDSNPAYGGSIFSGNFSGNAGFKSTIEDALTNFYGDFIDADGSDSGMVQYTGATTITPNSTAPCGQIEDSTGTTSGLWTRVKLQGIAQGDPSVTTLDDKLGTSSPVAAMNPNGSGNWANELGTDQDQTQYNTARSAETAPLMNAVTQNSTMCTTLGNLNIPGAACTTGGE